MGFGLGFGSGSGSGSGVGSLAWGIGSKFANILWMTFFIGLNVLTLLIFRDRPRAFIFYSLLAIPLEFLFGLLIFKVTNFNFDFSHY